VTFVRTGLVLVFTLPIIYGQDVACSSIQAQARSAMQRRDYRAATEHLREALKVCRDKRMLRLELAQAYLMAQRAQDALEEAEGVLRDDPDEPAALKIKGNAAFLMRDLPLAKDTFIRLLDRRPSDDEGAYMLGRIYYQEGNLDLAIGQFERVRRLNSSHYKALDILGLCYQAYGDEERAKSYFLAAIKLVEKDHPEYEWPYVNLADLLLKAGDAKTAFDAASKAAKRNPQSPRSFYIGAKALDQLGKTELAANWLERAVSLDPSSSECWYLLARVYRKLQKNDKAEEAQQKFREVKSRETAPGR